jgi:nicotinate-nucleotide pyrophosphorylase (carboxylating)
MPLPPPNLNKKQEIFFHFLCSGPRVRQDNHAGRLPFSLGRRQMTFTAAESAACRHLVDLALAEDLGAAGDLTSEATIPAGLEGKGAFVARAAGVIAGLPAAALVADKVDSRLNFDPLIQDGSRVNAGTRIAIIAGPMRGLLTTERTALNFLQRLSGIASLTRQYVDAIAGLPCMILDTRKTTPGWRLLEKYAVRQGGGHNHRVGLFDGIIIKDNHLAAQKIEDRGSSPGAPGEDRKVEAVRQAIRTARAACGLTIPLEVEVDDLEQLDVALQEQPDIILLDNMSLETLREASRRRNEKAPTVLLEASGGVNLTTVRAIAETGVDRISVGALTHSAPALDIALDYLL